MKKNSKSPIKKGAKAKQTKAQRPVQRDTKEVLAELVGTPTCTEAQKWPI